MKQPILGDEVAIDVNRLIVSRLLVQANSGGGKSFLLRRLLEQTFGLVQHIVIDPEGEFHTLRERFGYVLAGPDGEAPATVDTAALLAIRLLELGQSAGLLLRVRWLDVGPVDAARTWPRREGRLRGAAMNRARCDRCFFMPALVGSKWCRACWQGWWIAMQISGLIRSGKL